MLCDACKKNPAVVHMTKNVNGNKMERHLCEVCAKAREENALEHHFSIPNFLAGLMESNMHSPLNMKYLNSIHCHRCGTTLNQVKQSGRLGCDECYEVFREKISPLIKRIHGNINHVGKVPKRTGGVIRLRRQVRQLKGKLQEAIVSEAFEEAAKLRDEIKALEKEVNKDQEG
ncbi:UvrB/UvrC motif-containing protein [Alkaliphilus hydrothermalis]|uniref:Protein arginine kinase activator n=1 Tax=Alkaliphilus hydrothermalis TaxID=1482730 RepID=A0ABS2NQX3_9FIRM|nr:UvrB/UvrC motif-containing protein [Alkaliphilus hydrothermalis]MBM7615344.1 protein arginine kinase activator [Alkaliphilus hydrothermalis]